MPALVGHVTFYKKERLLHTTVRPIEKYHLKNELSVGLAFTEILAIL